MSGAEVKRRAAQGLSWAGAESLGGIGWGVVATGRAVSSKKDIM